MATPAQITANRANAQKSTGPRSAEGKSASRFNALKHGMTPLPSSSPAKIPPSSTPSPPSTLASSAPNPPLSSTMSRPCSAPIGRRSASSGSRPISSAPSSPNPPVQPSPPPSSATPPPPNSSPALSARSPLSNAPGTAPTPNSTAPAGSPRAAGEQSFDRYLDRLCERPPITELASILFPPVAAVPDSPAVLTMPAEANSPEPPRAS